MIEAAERRHVSRSLPFGDVYAARTNTNCQRCDHRRRRDRSWRRRVRRRFGQQIRERADESSGYVVYTRRCIDDDIS